ncbi:MAG: low specificity L-threonine aldolase [Alphaproteobacteria bacterium]|nr:low specificity L-threonine aldolase [Alphaproteobacteria bacterium]
MSFISDTTAPVHPRIMEAIVAANAGVASSYGADPWTARAIARLKDIFETDCAVFLVASGTAANALALASITPPWGAIITHREAHIVLDEAGAPEFHTGGARLLLLDGPHAQITADALDAEASRHARANVHGLQPFTVSISQMSESGAVYEASEVAAISAVCRARGLKLHMDGARFANALVATGATPAEMSWKAGVDVLSFGATKNGAFSVEAIVCFDSAAAAQLPHLRKRSGHLIAKHRLLGAQMDAYLTDDLWLDNARQANAMAARLASVLTGAGGELAHPLRGNALFVRMDDGMAGKLGRAGVALYRWVVDGPGVYRFVTSWATREADVDACATALVA